MQYKCDERTLNCVKYKLYTYNRGCDHQIFLEKVSCIEYTDEWYMHNFTRTTAYKIWIWTPLINVQCMLIRLQYSCNLQIKSLSLMWKNRSAKRLSGARTLSIEAWHCSFVQRALCGLNLCCLDEGERTSSCTHFHPRCTYKGASTNLEATHPPMPPTHTFRRYKMNIVIFTKRDLEFWLLVLQICIHSQKLWRFPTNSYTEEYPIICPCFDPCWDCTSSYLKVKNSLPKSSM